MASHPPSITSDVVVHLNFTQVLFPISCAACVCCTDVACMLHACYMHVACTLHARCKVTDCQCCDGWRGREREGDDTQEDPEEKLCLVDVEGRTQINNISMLHIRQQFLCTCPCALCTRPCTFPCRDMCRDVCTDGCTDFHKDRMLQVTQHRLRGDWGGLGECRAAVLIDNAIIYSRRASKFCVYGGLCHLPP